MELKDTVDLMLSDNYKDRLAAEYLQLKIREVKLATFLDAFQAGDVKLTHKQVQNLASQHRIMVLYLEVLEARAKDEGVNFNEYTRP